MLTARSLTIPTETGVLQELFSDKYPHSRIFIAWEHKNLAKALKSIVAARGDDASPVPNRPGSGFDSLCDAGSGQSGLQAEERGADAAGGKLPGRALSAAPS
jgi:hypothetical protein